MSDFAYGFGKLVKESDFDTAVEKVTGALKEAGFGVLTKIDVQETLKKKLDVDFRRYLILGACNPQLANQALGADPHIGLLLPCNVVVQETGSGDLSVSVASPRAMFSLVDNPASAHIAEEAESRLRRVLEAVD